MTIDKVSLGFQGIAPIKQPRNPIQTPSQQEGGADKGDSFQDALSEALNEMNRVSLHADAQIKNLATGQTQNPHDAMVALEKADVAFQLMNAVRTKIVRAYEEIMRTQV